MTLQEAHHKLKLARRRQRRTALEIKQLREFIIKRGGDPDNRVNLVPRNALIYKLHIEGMNYAGIARVLKLSPTRIMSVCKRLEFVLENRRGEHEKYEKLLKKSKAQLAKISAVDLTINSRTSEG